MTGTRATCSVPAVISRDELGSLGTDLGGYNGESKSVCLVPELHGWIFKEFLKPLPISQTRRLDRLVQLPASLTAAESELVDAHTCWPGSRVVNAARDSVGVLLPLAPDQYMFDWEIHAGRPQRKALEVDVLALPADRQASLRLPPQSVDDRIAVCTSMAQVGALFERHELVYLDWSYSNAFWSAGDHTAFVIDMDGCSFGARPQIEAPNWPDPLVPLGHNAGNESDRYRLALLIARCLTGERGDPGAVRAALNGSLRQHSLRLELVVELLIQTLNARNIADRPPVAAISAALGGVTGHASGPSPATVGGVKSWRPIDKRPAARRPAPAGPLSGAGATVNRPTADPHRPSPNRSTARSYRSPVPSAGRSARSGGSPYGTPRYHAPPKQPAKAATGSVWGAVALVVMALIALGVMLAVFT